MRKSHSITLTVVAAMATAGAFGQSPAPEGPVNCIPQAGQPLPPGCVKASRGSYTEVLAGGFGTTAQHRHAGG